MVLPFVLNGAWGLVCRSCISPLSGNITFYLKICFLYPWL